MSIKSTQPQNVSIKLIFFDTFLALFKRIDYLAKMENAMDFDKNSPYNDLPLLPPPTDIENKAILKKAIKANTALARLNGKANLIPDPSILLNNISLQEAKTSSEIENIFTTHDSLFKAMSTNLKYMDSGTKEVIHYREALLSGVQTIKESGLLTKNLLINLANIINETSAGIRKHPGTKIMNNQGQVIYTPPEGETIILDKLDNLEKFIHNQDTIDPLIKCAVIHYQFEAIHPFADGNGRTGRILNLLYLVQQNLIAQPILFLSKYLIRHKKDYNILLRNVTEKSEWEKWILFFLTAIEKTSESTIETIDSIFESFAYTVDRIKTGLPKIYTKELVELLYNKPYCKIQFLVQAGIAKRQTAGDYLMQLEALGVLQSTQIGKEKIYINSELLEILKK